MLQADFYRQFRLPVLLVADSRLGGIGSTISAFESLHVRGYDVEAIVIFHDPKYKNHDYLAKHFKQHDIKVYQIPTPPEYSEGKKDETAMTTYYDKHSESDTMQEILGDVNLRHFNRISKLTSMPSKAESIIWHPFRQHALPQNIVAIDSAYNDFFQAYNQESDPVFTEVSSQTTPPSPTSPAQPSAQMLTKLFDASASWWTQGLGHGNPKLALTAAHAAGRYGHVMFANAVHEPALDLSYNLLEALRSPRLSRVFFTDNGSTGMEVAVKMALRASCQRYSWEKEDAENPVGVIGLKGSYHGDTIGVMNCSEPNTFNEKVDWYKPWGFWFDPPQVMMKKGKWEIEIPSSMSDKESSTMNSTLTFDSLPSIFDFASRETDAQFYKAYISRTLKTLTHDQKRRFGALIIEPMLMGAGGMILVDPLFQRTLIKTIREDSSLVNPSYTPPPKQKKEKDTTEWTGLPLIADEVFTGLYRLGRPSSSSFLSHFPKHNTLSSIVSGDIAPDISVHAKLLTGGLLPLALTAASTSIFNTFLSSSKSDALLHGHSYTAHPIGCAVANKSLDEMRKKHSFSNLWNSYRTPWSTQTPSTSQHESPAPTSSESPEINTEDHFLPSPSLSTKRHSHSSIFSFFSPTFLTTLSHHPLVSGCFALGTVLAITIRPPPATSSSEGSGYNSTATLRLQRKLLETATSPSDFGIHARTLGDVMYFMTGIMTPMKTVEGVQKKVLRVLDEEVRERRGPYDEDEDGDGAEDEE